jgi:hypothetical protein
MTEPTDIKFSKSPRKSKKYQVEFTWNGKKYKRHFGAVGYSQYKDITPLKLYSAKDNLSEQRRKAYYKRHGKSDDPLTARYWARYLW